LCQHRGTYRAADFQVDYRQYQDASGRDHTGYVAVLPCDLGDHYLALDPADPTHTQVAISTGAPWLWVTHEVAQWAIDRWHQQGSEARRAALETL
jgi:hypothetical protein